jgi:hypothetical protein
VIEIDCEDGHAVSLAIQQYKGYNFVNYEIRREACELECQPGACDCDEWIRRRCRREEEDE